MAASSTAMRLVESAMQGLHEVMSRRNEDAAVIEGHKVATTTHGNSTSDIFLYEENCEVPGYADPLYLTHAASFLLYIFGAYPLSDSPTSSFHFRNAPRLKQAHESLHRHRSRDVQLPATGMAPWLLTHHDRIIVGCIWLIIGMRVVSERYFARAIEGIIVRYKIPSRWPPPTLPCTHIFRLYAQYDGAFARFGPCQ
jgi:hypothetical protein